MLFFSIILYYFLLYSKIINYEYQKNLFFEIMFSEFRKQKKKKRKKKEKREE